MDPRRTNQPRSRAWRTAALVVLGVCALGVGLQVAAFVEVRAALEVSATEPALVRTAWLALSATAVSVVGLVALVGASALALGAMLARLAAAEAHAAQADVQLVVSESRWRALEEELRASGTGLPRTRG